MTITCAHCGSDSAVKESRQRAFTNRGRTNINIVRIRQCLACRWRWKTVEMILPKARYKIKEPSNVNV